MLFFFLVSRRAEEFGSFLRKDRKRASSRQFWQNRPVRDSGRRTWMMAAWAGLFQLVSKKERRAGSTPKDQAAAES